MKYRHIPQHRESDNNNYQSLGETLRGGSNDVVLVVRSHNNIQLPFLT